MAPSLETSMSELTATRRKRLKSGSFAYITDDGERKLPINDESHVRNAVARFAATSFEDAGSRRTAARRIVAAARKHGIELSSTDDVVRAARRD
jgi:hypothetical protein